MAIPLRTDVSAIVMCSANKAIMIKYNSPKLKTVQLSAGSSYMQTLVTSNLELYDPTGETPDIVIDDEG